MTALFRTRLEQHGSGNLGDAVGGKKGESSNLLGASLPCSQQSASINKGLAAPRSILIFKLTAERIRAFPALSLAIGRDREERERAIERGGRIHPRTRARVIYVSAHPYMHVYTYVCLRAYVCRRACARAYLLADECVHIRIEIQTATAPAAGIHGIWL